MESQPQNPQFRNNPENFHPCNYFLTHQFKCVLDKKILTFLCPSFFFYLDLRGAFNMKWKREITREISTGQKLTGF